VSPTAFQSKFYTDTDQKFVDSYGYLSWDKLINNDSYYSWVMQLVSTVKTVADYYFVKHINLFSNSGVTLLNQSFYYPEDGGVHPLPTMHERWAQIMLECLT
jgi:hypothetical protein